MRRRPSGLATCARWVRHAWQVTLAYLAGFVVLMLALGWQPTLERGEPPAASVPSAAAVAPRPRMRS